MRIAAICLSAALAGTAVVAVSTAMAQDVCRQLWIERNSIYKSYGYCFKTRDAIAYFGNAGCSYDYEGDIPFSRYDRDRIARIRAQERQYGCR